jgi:hypothetical protein
MGRSIHRNKQIKDSLSLGSARTDKPKIKTPLRDYMQLRIATQMRADAAYAKSKAIGEQE